MHFIKCCKEKGAFQTLFLVGWELVTESSFCVASLAVQFVILNIISDDARLLSHLPFFPLSYCSRLSMVLKSMPARQWIWFPDVLAWPF